MNKLLPSVVLYLVFSGAACAASEAGNWYVGGTLGLSSLRNWSRAPVDSYYGTQGYVADYAPGALNVGANAIEFAWKELMFEGNLFGGYRLAEWAGIELGLSDDSNSYKIGYKKPGTGSMLWSERDFNARSRYVAATLRPFPGRGRAFFVKLGRHASHLDIAKKVTGNDPNLAAIAAGDRLYGDGNNQGYGSLVAVGTDIPVSWVGAVRVEYSRYNNLGGTLYGKSALVVGYLGHF